jgi:alpha-galactosidase
MINSEILSRGVLSFVDNDVARLKLMMELGRKAIEYRNSPLRLEGSANRRELLEGADFVVLSFSKNGVYYRDIDCRIAQKYGVLMCSGDTIGPGGIFRAMRELPEILRVARDVEELCPEAWLINYINPTAVNGIALKRYTNAKSFALCDTLHMPYKKREYMVRCRIVDRVEKITPEMEEHFDLKIAGVNHFTWILKAEYDGKDVLAALRKTMEEAAHLEKDEGDPVFRYNNRYALELWGIFGLCPHVIAHTKEYVPYWQNYGVTEGRLPPLSIFDTKKRQKRHKKMWEDVKGFISGNKPMEEFFAAVKSDPATDVIESMWSGSKKAFYINTGNRGAIENIYDEAFLELLCDIDMQGPSPRSAGRFPLGIRAQQVQILDTHELTVEAVVRHDRSLLRRAMLTDPLVNSISDAEAMISELFEVEKAALDPEWF